MEDPSIETISFIDNTALDFGGAISVANSVKLNISYVRFAFNEAESGGAVVVTSTAKATAGFQRCRFECNKATSGGGLYLSGEGHSFLQGSVFRYNVAGKTSSGENLVFACQPSQCVGSTDYWYYHHDHDLRPYIYVGLHFLRLNLMLSDDMLFVSGAALLASSSKYTPTARDNKLIGDYCAGETSVTHGHPYMKLC